MSVGQGGYIGGYTYCQQSFSSFLWSLACTSYIRPWHKLTGFCLLGHKWDFPEDMCQFCPCWTPKTTQPHVRRRYRLRPGECKTSGHCLCGAWTDWLGQTRRFLGYFFKPRYFKIGNVCTNSQFAHHVGLFIQEVYHPLGVMHTHRSDQIWMMSKTI